MSTAPLSNLSATLRRWLGRPSPNRGAVPGRGSRTAPPPSCHDHPVFAGVAHSMPVIRAS